MLKWWEVSILLMLFWCSEGNYSTESCTIYWQISSHFNHFSLVEDRPHDIKKDFRTACSEHFLKVKQGAIEDITSK
jgi:hypothetical protein